MEKVFYFDGIILPPTSSFLARDGFEELGSDFVPATKRLDDEWLEEDPLGAAVVKMVPNLCGFSHLDGSGRSVSGTMKDSFLNGRDDADVECDFAPVDPVFDKNVGRPGERAGDETRHFLFRVKRCMLRLC